MIQLLISHYASPFIEKDETKQSGTWMRRQLEVWAHLGFQLSMLLLPLVDCNMILNFCSLAASQSSDRMTPIELLSRLSFCFSMTLIVAFLLP